MGKIKNAVVTGGTDGIGKQVALGLARAGHHVIIVGHDKDKGIRAEKEIREVADNPNIWFFPADLSLMGEVRRFAERVTTHWSGLHYLVLNAGMVRGRRQLTTEGIESNFALNYLGRFVLVNQLMPLLRADGKIGDTARIVTVSGAAQNGKIYYEDVDLTKNFNTLRAVLQFCQANDVFIIELSRRLMSESPNPHITISSLKLGVVKTRIREQFPLWMKWLVPLILDPLLALTPEQAAESVLALIQDENLEGKTGMLFRKIKKLKHIVSSSRFTDPEEGGRLWALSERLVDAANIK